MSRKIALIGCAVVLVATAAQSMEVGMRYPVRFTYLTARKDTADWIDENTPHETQMLLPINLSFAPYYQFDFGLFIWGDLGVASLFMGDLTLWRVPLGLGIGYIVPRLTVAPYAKVGVRYPIAGGDYVESSSLGVLAAVGVEFIRRDKFDFLFEIGYDSSSVTMQHRRSMEEIRGGLTASLGVVF